MKRASSEEIGLLVALCRALGVRGLYPAGHPTVERAVEGVLEALRTCAMALGLDAVTFLELEGEVFVNDRPVRSEALHLAPFVRTMERLGIQRLTLTVGLTAEEARALVAGLAGAEEVSTGPHVDLGRVRVTGTVAGGPTVGPPGPGGGGGGAGAGAGLGEELLDRAEEAFGGVVRGSIPGRGGAASRLDALVWELLEGLASTRRSFLLLAPVRSAERAFYVHSLHVALLALAQARSLGLGGVVLHEIGMAAMLHDVGKLSLPRELRERRGRLGDEDWERMKLHPELGAARLAATEGVPGLAVLVAYEHHLRWDGKPSFPRPSTPRTPNLASRITAVADTWDAVVSQRHPIPGPERRAAVAAWRERAGTRLDPFLADHFLRLMQKAEERS